MVKKVAKVLNLEGKPTGKVDLPPVFATPLRADVIKRAVLAIQSNRRQPQGRDPMAGKRTSAESRGTGGGIARLPRRKGGDAKAAFAPGTVSGRQGITAKDAETAVTELKARFGADLQFVYSEDFQTVYDRQDWGVDDQEKDEAQSPGRAAYGDSL